MPIKVVVSGQDGKAFQKDVDAPSIVGLKIGEQIDGSLVGLNGYKLQITGGSDKEGFPMRRDVPGPARKRVLLTSGTGYRPPQSGIRKRKTVRGNTISEYIVQVNFKVVSAGEKAVHELWGITPKQPKPKWQSSEQGSEDSKAELSKPPAEGAENKQQAEAQTAATEEKK